MALDPSEIAKILATPEKPKRESKHKALDTSIRDYQTWFKMRHVLIDRTTNKSAKCSNPNCPAPNQHMVAIVDEVLMCRICFLEGYNLVDDEQLQLEG